MSHAAVVLIFLKARRVSRMAAQSTARLDESRQDLVRAEEDPRPEKIQAELYQKEPQAAAAAGAGARLPDDPRGDCHERVKNRPHRTEDLIGGLNGGFTSPAYQVGIARAAKMEEDAGCETQRQPADERQPGVGLRSVALPSGSSPN